MRKPFKILTILVCAIGLLIGAFYTYKDIGNNTKQREPTSESGSASGVVADIQDDHSKDIKTPGWLQGLWKSDDVEMEVSSENIEISDTFETVSLRELVDSSFSNFVDEESQKLLRWKQRSDSNIYKITVFNKDTGLGRKLIDINKIDGNTINVKLAGKDLGNLIKI